MKLPNANQVIVDREKIEVYLLKPVHSGNGGKADFSPGLVSIASDGKYFRQL